VRASEIKLFISVLFHVVRAAIDSATEIHCITSYCIIDMSHDDIIDTGLAEIDVKMTPKVRQV